MHVWDVFMVVSLGLGFGLASFLGTSGIVGLLDFMLFMCCFLGRGIWVFMFVRLLSG